MITDEDLNEWQRIVDEATEGPWEWCSDDDTDGFAVAGSLDKRRRRKWALCSCGVGYESCGINTSQENIDFIVMARAAVPALIEELRASRRTVEVLKEALIETNKLLLRVITNDPLSLRQGAFDDK